MSRRKSTLKLTTGECIDEVQRLLREKLSHDSVTTQVFGLETQRRHLLDIIKRCVNMGESNSAIIIGPRGSGKSMILKSILEEVKLEDNVQDNLLEVHLNGLLQTDDKVALKEITRQLQLENTVGDKVFGSFAETLSFLLEALKSDKKTSRPVLFILDEFDLFAHHKNQTLLYNLFDISQSAQTPIAVFGLTCRLDVIELLEKRVKSRFSHRQIHIFSSLSFDEYIDAFLDILSLPKTFPDKNFTKEWNSHIQSLNDDNITIDVLRRIYQNNKSIGALKRLLLLPVCRLSEDHPFIRSTDLLESCQYLTMDSKAAMLHGVSVLELCLIIAMKHLTTLYDGDPVNFQMVYNEYQKFIQRRGHSVQCYEKAVVLKAFEHLLALEMIKPADGGQRSQKEYRPMMLLVDAMQIDDALQKYPNCPTEVKQWNMTEFHA
uniref:Origin recognition complex subunit 4 n=1 Tax=Saccoglossus kowalevskii TaxID=10224 RepID=A0ABM0MLF7_SACKO|nr:PREDICTED: origin recognition complex subunit 4-like [Saccoglossus kowalevskii]